MAKPPADQFYWKDWLSDAELQNASASSRGIWINALCYMWFAKTKGEISGSKDKLCHFCNCTIDEFDQFLEEGEALGFCYIKRNSNGILTLRNRRMYRHAKKQESNRLRQKRYYEKHKPNANSTKSSRPLSPSPTPNHSACARAKQNPYQKPNDDPRSNWIQKPTKPCVKCGQPSIDQYDGQYLCLKHWPKPDMEKARQLIGKENDKTFIAKKRRGSPK